MPLPLMAGAAALSALSSLWGAFSQNKTNRANQRMMQQRQQGLDTDVRGRLGSGPSEAEKILMGLLTGGEFGGEGGGGFDNEAFNTGQDSLMQMLREDPFDPSGMFKSWEPIEQRQLDLALSDAFAGASGLGQRFGSAMMKQEGQVRGEAAQGGAARREEATMKLHETDADRRMNIANILGNMGVQEGQANQNQMALMLQGIMGLGGMEQNRSNSDMQLLQLMYGMPGGAQQGSAMPGALGDMSQMMMFLPMLMQMMNRGGGAAGGGVGGTPALSFGNA